MSLSRFRLITFDVTDTILQFRTSPAKQYGEIGAMFGILCDNNQLGANFKANWQQMNRTHPNFGLNTQLGWENWWKELIIGTFRDNGVKIADNKMIKFSEHLLETFKTSACWQNSYGAVELLNYLKSQQDNARNESSSTVSAPIKLGVISNFDPRLDVLLKNMKINHFFDFVINSYDVGHEKPSKQIFEHAAKTSSLENLQPNECLHIGNTVIKDYLGSRNVGWNSVLIHETDPEVLRKKYGDQIDRNFVFHSLFDFHKKMSDNTIKW